MNPAKWPDLQSMQKKLFEKDVIVIYRYFPYQTWSYLVDASDHRTAGLCFKWRSSSYEEDFDPIPWLKIYSFKSLFAKDSTSKVLPDNVKYQRRLTSLCYPQFRPEILISPLPLFPLGSFYERSVQTAVKEKTRFKLHIKVQQEDTDA